MDFSNESRNVQIGIYLKTLREEQNLSLEQLSKISQVPKLHIEAIEAGRFSRYDDFYLKLYLRKYTQALDVDLEQLYTYATQQKAPELPVNPKPEKVLTGMQADIATVVPKTEKTEKSAPKAQIQTKGVSTTNKKGKLGHVLIALFLILLVGGIIAVAFIALRNGNGGDNGEAFVPPPIDIPSPNLNGENGYDNYEPEPMPEPEPEPMPEDFTSVVKEGYAGTIQTFLLSTELTEIVLRIEHNGQNWIDIDNRIHSDTFEYTFDATESTFTFAIGAIHSIEAIFVNDVEVPITTEDLIGRQTFIFNILSDIDIDED